MPKLLNVILLPSVIIVLPSVNRMPSWLPEILLPKMLPCDDPQRYMPHGVLLDTLLQEISRLMELVSSMPRKLLEKVSPAMVTFLELERQIPQKLPESVEFVTRVFRTRNISIPCEVFPIRTFAIRMLSQLIMTTCPA